MDRRTQLIGEVAGKIYRYLESHGETAQSSLELSVDARESTLFQQALGWLAREDKVNFRQAGKNLKVAIK